MYFILLSEYNTKTNIHSVPRILSHFDETVATAIELLNLQVRQYVHEQFGARSGERVQVVDIDSMTDITEPAEYGVYLYKLSSQPERIYLYIREIRSEKKTGYFVDYVEDVVVWRQAAIFDLTHYRMGKGVEESASEIELVLAGLHKVRVPKQMTVAPCVELISELRNSDRFLKRRCDLDNMSLEI